MSKKNDFKSEDKIKCLLWCQRHCCLCDKQCGIHIEVAHIEEAKSDLDNAIPLCYDCHGMIGHYRDEHPKGNKPKPKELRKRREQIYDKYTRELVPPIHIEMTQTLYGPDHPLQFPNLGFRMMHVGDFLPVKVLVRLDLFLGNKKLPEIKDDGHYSGRSPWNLNPRKNFQSGALRAPSKIKDNEERFSIKITHKIIDCYEREHEFLPAEWVYDREQNIWWANP